MRLHVGVIAVEQLFHAGYRERLGDVDVLAAAVVPLARIAFGVLVRQHTAHRLHHGGAGVVFAGDHFQAIVLAVHFAADGSPNIRILRLEEIHSDGEEGSWKKASILTLAPRVV